MKEIKIVELSKEELKVLKELTDREETLRLEQAKLRAQQDAFWNQLRRQHSLNPSFSHYIKDNALYTQEV